MQRSLSASEWSTCSSRSPPDDGIATAATRRRRAQNGQFPVVSQRAERSSKHGAPWHFQSDYRSLSVGLQGLRATIPRHRCNWIERTARHASLVIEHVVSRRGVPRTGRREYVRPVRFSVLGSLEVSGEEGSVPLGGPKQRIVLAHLVLGVNRVVSAEHLIDALWGEELPEDPKSTLQVYVSRLRSALGPRSEE